MKKLDRKRDYGTVVGDTEGRMYHQDGVYFDADGREHGAPIYEPPAAETIGEEAARLAEEQRLKEEAEAAEKAAAEQAAKEAADKAAAEQTAASGGSKKKAAAPADDQVSKQLAS